MPSEAASRHGLLSCQRGSTLIGYSSLMLLVAIAAITLLGQTDAGNEHPSPRRNVTSSR